nr:MAG TPA: hypothetical protein [Bacteriophage sp.]
MLFYLLSKEPVLYRRCYLLDYRQESPDHPEYYQH